MRAPLLLVVVYFTVLAVTFVALSGGAARAQGSADVSLEQQIQAALANAGFDPGPADGNVRPEDPEGDSGVAAGKRARRDRIPDSRPTQINPQACDADRDAGA